MQKLDMSSYGVEELDANEMKNLDGGILSLITVPLGVVAVGIMIAIGTGLNMINSAAGDLLVQPEICFWDS